MVRRRGGRGAGRRGERRRESVFSHRLTHIPLPEYSSWDHFQNYTYVEGGRRKGRGREAGWRAGGRGEGGKRKGGRDNKLKCLFYSAGMY